MEIELKNGEKIFLEVTPLLLEYLEDYDGGVEQLKKDAKGVKDSNGYTRTMYAANQLIYALVASNYDKPLTYRQAVRLVKIEDVTKIADFVINNIPENGSNQVEDNIHNHKM
ncbi:MAG: hypothetical protein IJH12_06870 [Clostridia bacterium]|nr:hypothetical protein [Clostridia bacterium]